MSIRAILTGLALVLVGCTGDAAVPDDIDQVGSEDGTTRIVWVEENGTEVYVYTPRVGSFIEHHTLNEQCQTCGPVPDPWYVQQQGQPQGPVPDPWRPTDH